MSTINTLGLPDEMPFRQRSATKFKQMWDNVTSISEAIWLVETAPNVQSDPELVVDFLLKVHDQPAEFYEQPDMIRLKYAAMRTLADFVSGLKAEDPVMFRVHQKALAFFGRRHDGMLFAPYPYKVLKYLDKFKMVWMPPAAGTKVNSCGHEGGPHPWEPKGACNYMHQIIQGLTDEFVRAVLEWGWAQSLVGTRHHRGEIISGMEKYIAEHEVSEKGALAIISQIPYATAPEDIDWTGQNAQELIDASVYFSLRTILLEDREQSAAA